MEFKDRQAANSGRVILENVQTKERTAYDVILADEPTEHGTPLNAATFDALQEDIMDKVADLVAVGVESVVYCGQDAAGGNIYELQFANGYSQRFTAPRGIKGVKGDKGDKGDVGATFSLVDTTLYITVKS